MLDNALWARGIYVTDVRGWALSEAKVWTRTALWCASCPVATMLLTPLYWRMII